MHSMNFSAALPDVMLNKSSLPNSQRSQKKQTAFTKFQLKWMMLTNFIISFSFQFLKGWGKVRQQILGEGLADILLVHICQSPTDFHNIYKNNHLYLYILRFSILSTFLTSSSKYSISSSSIFFFAVLNCSSLTSLSSLTSFATSPISFTSP